MNRQERKTRYLAEEVERRIKAEVKEIVPEPGTKAGSHEPDDADLQIPVADMEVLAESNSGSSAMGSAPPQGGVADVEDRKDE